jgi:diguanylate cyclase (GGDEF)-like protein
LETNKIIKEIKWFPESRALLFSLIIFITSMLISLAEVSSGWVDIIYPVSGLVLGCVFLDERNYKFSLLYTIVSFWGILMAIFFTSYKIALVSHAITNTLEIMIILFMTKYRIGLTIKVERFQNLVWFGAITIVASIIPNLAYAVIKISTDVTSNENWFDVFKTGALADIVGVVIMMPFILSMRKHDIKVNTIKIKPYFIRLFNFIAISIYLFVLTRTGYPLLFMIFPPILLSIVIMGYRGAIMHLVIVAIIGMEALECQFSPFMFVTDSGLHERTIGIQIFLLTISITTLVFTSLLADRYRLEQALFITNVKLSEMATTDALTGLANRRGMENFVNEIWMSSLKRKEHMSIILLDVDKFKIYNDRYGHLAGDDCLKSVANTMKKVTRGQDIAVRYGGEEFMLMLSRADTLGAMRVADRLRKAIIDLQIPHPDTNETVITASFGVISTEGFPEIRDVKTLICRADEALYRAKKLGRNRVELAQEEKEENLLETKDNSSKFQ